MVNPWQRRSEEKPIFATVHSLEDWPCCEQKVHVDPLDAEPSSLPRNANCDASQKMVGKMMNDSSIKNANLQVMM